MSFAAMEFEADGIPGGDLTIAAGALDAIERILWEELKTGDTVAIEDPTHPDVRELVSASGFITIALTLDGEGPEPDSLADALAAGCRALVMTPRAQNPTGAAISAGRAADLRRVLRSYPDVVVIENDYAAPIAGVPIAPIRTAERERWAIIRSTSQFLGPDLRLALVAGDALTIARVRRRQALGARWVSRIVQRLVLAYWSDPSGARKLARAAEIYGLRRAGLVSALAEQGIAASAKSGFNVWLPVREETAVVAALMEKGWAVAAGESFRMRSQPAIRVTTSALDQADALRFAADLASVTGQGRA
jgi:DNA-binding transcriptional MocR family regulator